MPGATKGEVTATISAPPERVYELVSDVTRMGEWSPECRRCEWLAGAAGASVGACFRGHNRMGPLRWSTTAKIVAADPGREFAFTTVLGEREETRWRYGIEPSGSDTLISESYEFVWAPLYIRMSNLIMPRDKQLHDGMRQTLARIKAVAEAETV